MARGPDPHKERRWLNLILRWQRSHLSAREFCRRYQLQEASFYAWRRTLSDRGLWKNPLANPRPQKPTSTSDTPRFLQLQFTPTPRSSSSFEIVLPDNLVLRVPHDFDANTLRQLLATLKEPSC